MKQRNPGFSLVEITVGIIILASAMIPLYATFTSGAKASTSSRLAYMATQVARDTLEEIRNLPFDKVGEDLVNEVNGAVEGKVFAISHRFRTLDAVGTADDSLVQGDAPEYPPEYSRIQRSLTVDSVNDRLKKVTLEVLWQESRGSSREKQRTGLRRFVTLIAQHNVDPAIPETPGP